MGFDLKVSVSTLTVFTQGIISFISPCVLPLLPLYIGYLTGNAGNAAAEDAPRSRVFLNTCAFTLGISFAFFALGFGFSAVGRFFSEWDVWFTRICGAVVILFGLYQLGVLGLIGGLAKEHRLPFRLEKMAMNPLTALIMGFTFSFAWTPCVGPTLTSVLLMASTASTAGEGYLMIGLYTLGFVIPFLIVGLFAGSSLRFLKKHMNVVKYTTKIGGAIMVVMGIMLVTGWFSGVNSFFSSIAGIQQAHAEESERAPIAAPDFELVDQNGETHTMDMYRGKTVFMNFFATWCGPCKMEIPDIQALYEKHGMNAGDVAVIALANPRADGYSGAQNASIEEVTAFLNEYNVTYPVLMDVSGELFNWYGISAFPTTFMIDANGNVFGYVRGMLTADQMDMIIDQTLMGASKASK